MNIIIYQHFFKVYNKTKPNVSALSIPKHELECNLYFFKPLLLYPCKKKKMVVARKIGWEKRETDQQINALFSEASQFEYKLLPRWC